MRRALPLAVTALAFGSAVAHAGPAPGAPDARTAAAGVNAFTADVLRATAASGGNAFLSPYSLAVAMAMVRAGAKGTTAAQMDAVLHIPPDAPASYRALVAALAAVPPATEWVGGERTAVPAYALSVANGLFSQKGWAFEESFRSTIGGDFGAELREIDFAQTEAARKAVNDWVASKTKDRIQDIVPPGLPKPDTRMALANAVHFKAQWDRVFSEAATQERPFTVAPGKDVTAKAMATTGQFLYGESADAQVLEIPYRERATSMVVVLPKARDGLDALVRGLTAQRLESYLSGLQSRKVALRLPRFSFTAAFDASETLKALGMKDAFSDRADFSGISRAESLLVSAVLHKAFVAVDENGTEAAAATVALMAVTSAAPRPSDPPTPFVVDHPFLFVVRHVGTGAILFAGRVVDPTAN